MFFKFLFNRMSVQKRVALIRRNGVVIGTRIRSGRKIHMYMLRDLFAEIMFKNDNPSNEVESFATIVGLEEFNRKLENEVRFGKYS